MNLKFYDGQVILIEMHFTKEIHKQIITINIYAKIYIYTICPYLINKPITSIILIFICNLVTVFFSPLLQPSRTSFTRCLFPKTSPGLPHLLLILQILPRDFFSHVCSHPPLRDFVSPFSLITAKFCVMHVY